MYTSVNIQEIYEHVFCVYPILYSSYASRTKNIRNTPIINENSSYILLQQYAQEIERLRAIINSSSKQIRSLSRSHLHNDNKFDDQHSLKTIFDHQIPSENPSTTKSINSILFLSIVFYFLPFQ